MQIERWSVSLSWKAENSYLIHLSKPILTGKLPIDFIGWKNCVKSKFLAFQLMSQTHHGTLLIFDTWPRPYNCIRLSFIYIYVGKYNQIVDMLNDLHTEKQLNTQCWTRWMATIGRLYTVTATFGPSWLCSTIHQNCVHARSFTSWKTTKYTEVDKATAAVATVGRLHSSSSTVVWGTENRKAILITLVPIRVRHARIIQLAETRRVHTV